MGKLVAGVALVSCGIAGACASAPPRPAPPPVVVPAPPPLASAPTAARPAVIAPAPASDPCPPLGPDEVTEEDTPSLAGTTGKTNAGAWLTARGVGKSAFRSWLLAHDPKLLDDFDVDSIFEQDDSCATLVVGDAREDALLCTLLVRTSILRLSALAFVVRGKRIVPVLEVGYALPAMDWPDARWLDLQLAIAPDGLSADLHDRAKPGAVLVPGPAACHEHVARYEACERAHREGAALENVCPLVRDRSGTTGYGHHPATPPRSPIGGDRVPLVGCAEALPKLDALVAQTGPRDPFAAEFRGDRAFAVRSCAARGRYVWKQGHFVRAARP